MSQESQPTRPFPKRLYSKTLIGLLGATGAVSLLLVGLDFNPWSSLKSYGIAAFLIACGCVAWEFVERAPEKKRGATLAAWCALPLAVFLAFAALPFLALTVYPPLEDFLKPHHRVTGYLVNSGDTAYLEIVFPTIMKKRGSNLTLDGYSITANLTSREASGGPSLLTWKSYRTLRIELTPLLSTLGLEGPPQRIGINMLPDSPRFVDDTGLALSGQLIELKGPATR